MLANFKNDAKNGGLSHFECAATIASAKHKHWTLENQCFTAANKFNRKVILEVEKDGFDHTNLFIFRFSCRTL